MTDGNAPVARGYPVTVDAIQLQARPAEGGDWIDIYPAQLGAMAKAGHDIRAVEIDDGSREPDAWQYRFFVGDRWLPWREVDVPLARFCEKSQFNLDNGTCEIRSLYATPQPVTVAQARPMRADIAQIIDRGWKAGKSSNDVAEEILREFDPSPVSSTHQSAPLFTASQNIAEREPSSDAALGWADTRLAERLLDVVFMLDAPDAYNREYIAAVCRSILSSVTFAPRGDAI
jgi:hypothetical protein